MNKSVDTAIIGSQEDSSAEIQAIAKRRKKVLSQTYYSLANLCGCKHWCQLHAVTFAGYETYARVRI